MKEDKMSRLCKVTVEGFSPYSGGGAIHSIKAAESHEEFDLRTWPEKVKINEAGEVMLPAMAVHRGLLLAAKGSGIKVGKRSIASYVETAVAPMGDHPIYSGKGKPMRIEDMSPETLFLPSDGKALHKGGKGQRVRRTFPTVTRWSAIFEVMVLHEELHSETRLRALFEYMGMYVGVGRFRPERGGFYGRFKVRDLSLS